MVTLLTDRGRFDLPAHTESDALWVDAVALAEATGWELKPEGFCKDGACVPLPRGRETHFVKDGKVDAARLWRHAGHPIVSSKDRSAWSLGTSAAMRAESLAGLEAPELALPDLDGRIRRLSEQRGRKVFLATWASW